MKPEKRQARRERIVEAARLVFRKYGYRKASLEDVASAAGMGKATLYHYFEGKDALFGEVLSRRYQGYRTALMQALESEPCAVAKLTRYAGFLAEFHQREASESSLTLAERIAQFPDIAKHLRGFQHTEVKFLSEILTAGIESGEFRRIDVALTSRLLFFTMKAAVVETCEHPDSVKQAVEQLLGLLFDGLLSRDSGLKERGNG